MTIKFLIFIIVIYGLEGIVKLFYLTDNQYPRPKKLEAIDDTLSLLFCIGIIVWTLLLYF
jgi:hypothetical protein